MPRRARPPLQRGAGHTEPRPAAVSGAHAPPVPDDRSPDPQIQTPRPRHPRAAEAPRPRHPRAAETRGARYVAAMRPRSGGCRAAEASQCRRSGTAGRTNNDNKSSDVTAAEPLGPEAVLGINTLWKALSIPAAPHVNITTPWTFSCNLDAIFSHLI